MKKARQAVPAIIAEKLARGEPLSQDEQAALLRAAGKGERLNIRVAAVDLKNWQLMVPRGSTLTETVEAAMRLYERLRRFVPSAERDGKELGEWLAELADAHEYVKTRKARDKMRGRD